MVGLPPLYRSLVGTRSCAILACTPARERAPTGGIRGSRGSAPSNELNKSTLPSTRDACVSMILLLQSRRFG